MHRQQVRVALLALSGVLFPATFFYLSPVVILRGASEGIVAGSFVLFGVLFLSALVFGRAFCGWVCPGGAIGEAVGKLRDRPLSRGWVRWIKFGIWLPWLGLIAFFAIGAGGLRRVEFTYETWHGISVATWSGLFAFLLVVLVIVGLTLAVGRRGFCHTVCWMAPFMILGRGLANLLRLPGLRLRANRGKCVHCGLCTRVCPMSLNVQGMVEGGRMEHLDCILCARCADRCPAGVIALGLSSPGGLGTPGAGPAGKLGATRPPKEERWTPSRSAAGFSRPRPGRGPTRSRRTRSGGCPTLRSRNRPRRGRPGFPFPIPRPSPFPP